MKKISFSFYALFFISASFAIDDIELEDESPPGLKFYENTMSIINECSEMRLKTELDFMHGCKIFEEKISKEDTQKICKIFKRSCYRKPATSDVMGDPLYSTGLVICSKKNIIILIIDDDGDMPVESPFGITCDDSDQLKKITIPYLRNLIKKTEKELDSQMSLNKDKEDKQD